MILFPHFLAGAAITSQIQSAPLAMLLAFLSHYLLDVLPHIEYRIGDIKARNLQKSFFSFVKITLDILIGIFIVLSLAQKPLLALMGGFFAILPDGLTFLSFFFLKNKLLQKHLFFHHQKIHFLRNKKIPFFGKILIQVSVIAVSIFFLTF